MAESQPVFIVCKRCSKEFRAAECSPLTGGEASVVPEETTKSQPTLIADIPRSPRQRPNTGIPLPSESEQPPPAASASKPSRRRKRAETQQDMSPGAEEPKSKEPAQEEPEKKGIFRRIFRL